MFDFNRKEKKEAIERMNRSNSEFESVSNKIVIDYTNLFDDRKELKEKIDLTWTLINEFRNRPTEIDTKLNEIKVEYGRFNDLVQGIKDKGDNGKIADGTAIGAGISAGIGVLGPSAVTAYVSTFGSASTGAMISGLSGAAKTNAVLASIGGGSLASGGGGVAAGTAILSTLGVVGVGIAAIGLTTSGVLVNGENKKKIQQANEATEKIRSQIYILRGVMSEVSILDRQTYLASRDISSNYKVINDYSRDYNSLSTDEQYKLGTMVNDVLSYAKLLNKVVGQKA